MSASTLNADPPQVIKMKCEECECVKNERGIAYNRHGLYLCWDCMHNVPKVIEGSARVVERLMKSCLAVEPKKINGSASTVSVTAD